MKPRYLEYVRFDSLDNLYEKMLNIEVLNGKIRLNENYIEIVFHKDFVLTVKNGLGFNFYTNNLTLSKAVDSQDVWEYVYSIINDKDMVYVEWDDCFRRKAISLTTKKTYEDCYSYIKVYFYTNDI